VKRTDRLAEHYYKKLQQAGKTYIRSYYQSETSIDDERDKVKLTRVRDTSQSKMRIGRTIGLILCRAWNGDMLMIILLGSTRHRLFLGIHSNHGYNRSLKKKEKKKKN
jgi:hypothetical protein